MAAVTVVAVGSSSARLVTTRQVADLIGRSPNYVRALVQRGVLTPVGRRRRDRGRPELLFDAAALVKVMARHPEYDGHARGA